MQPTQPRYNVVFSLHSTHCNFFSVLNDFFKIVYLIIDLSIYLLYVHVMVSMECKELEDNF